MIAGFAAAARRGWLGIRVLDYRLDLAEVPVLDGSGPLLSCVPPAVLDLDKLGPGCNRAVDMLSELDLIAGSEEALVAVSYVRNDAAVDYSSPDRTWEWLIEHGATLLQPTDPMSFCSISAKSIFGNLTEG